MQETTENKLRVLRRIDRRPRQLYFRNVVFFHFFFAVLSFGTKLRFPVTLLPFSSSFVFSHCIGILFTNLLSNAPNEENRYKSTAHTPMKVFIFVFALSIEFKEEAKIDSLRCVHFLFHLPKKKSFLTWKNVKKMMRKKCKKNRKQNKPVGQ